MLQIGVPDKALIRATVYDNQWHNIDVKGPLYWDGEQIAYPYPTAYSDSSAGYLQSISYDTTAREYIYMITPMEQTEASLEIHAYPRSIPMWMGKPEGPYIIHGACKIKEDIDTWGGFWDVGSMEANLTIQDTTYVFYGGFLFDRAYHRVFYSDSSTGAGCGAPLSFSCFGIQQDNLDIMIIQSVKPEGCPVQNPVPFQHQGRINFPTLGEDFTFDNFLYNDNGGLQPDTHYLIGGYAAGEVNLTGKVFMFWPPQWQINQSVYWDSTLQYVWGRGFFRWNGFVTIYGDTIKVTDATGVGEFTRCAPGTAVEEDVKSKVQNTNIKIEAYPNPFTKKTEIRFHIPDVRSQISLKIYDLSGRLVKNFLIPNSQFPTSRVEWYGKNDSGEEVSTGVYFCKVKVGKSLQTKKLLLLRFRS